MANLTFTTNLNDAAFQAALKRMQTNTSAASSKISSGLSAALGSLGVSGAAGPFGAIAAALYGITKAGDNAQQALYKVGAATGDMAQASEVMGQLRKLTAETGVSANESAAQFTRFAIAGRQIGATNDEILKLISLTQKAGIVSGATAQETAAASTQLGQALASGRFQGDELRSIMENMPILAEALAKQLHVSVGELREMGKAGELTTDKVFPALLKAADEIDTKFQKIPIGMARSFTAAKEGIIADFASIDKAVGASNFFTTLIGAGMKFREMYKDTLTDIVGGFDNIDSYAQKKFGDGDTREGHVAGAPGDKRLDETMRDYNARKASQMKPQTEDDRLKALDTQRDKLATINKLQRDTLEIEKASLDQYKTRSQLIEDNENQIARLQILAKNNDSQRTAELDKQVAELKAQTFEMRVQENLMSNDEKRQANRDQGTLDRAVSKAERQEGRDAEEKQRRIDNGQARDDAEREKQTRHDRRRRDDPAAPGAGGDKITISNVDAFATAFADAVKPILIK